MLTSCDNSNAGVENGNRAILVSFDALNEEILRNTLTPEHVPALFRVFDEGSCAEYAQTAFPSLTAPSHASIWTGAFGNVSGATANWQHKLPRSENNVLESISGFSYDVLRADHFWIAAVEKGYRAGGHQVTQAPFAGGFPSAGEADTELEQRREHQRNMLQRDGVTVFNGYNRQIASDGVATEDDITWTDSAEWSGADELAGGVKLRAFKWEHDAAELYGLFHGEDRYDVMYIATEPDLSKAVEVRLHDPEQESPRGRDLARFFSEPLELLLSDDDRAWIRFRLFEAGTDGDSFVLYYPAVHISESNSADATHDYHEAVRGWFGNSSMRLYTNGGFGTTFQEGGDGTAELRYLESAELLTKVFNKGSEWLWNTKSPHVMADYFPLPDTIDHNILGFLSEEYPGYDQQVAEQAASLRARGWELADIRLSHLKQLAEAENGSVFVTGDHGMRTTWKQFHPNVVLRDAGLLVLDDEGEIDLTQTKAVSPNGYWITVNTTDWKDGIVEPEDRDEVLQRVEEALLAYRDRDGEQVVRRVYRSDEFGDELGIGGPAGGDLYWNMHPHYRASRFADRRSADNPTRLWTAHGFDSTDRDMYTAFCAYGSNFATNRIKGVRTIDIAPTIGEYIGFGSPQDATGISVLRDLRGE